MRLNQAEPVTETSFGGYFHGWMVMVAVIPGSSSMSALGASRTTPYAGVSAALRASLEICVAFPEKTRSGRDATTKVAGLPILISRISSSARENGRGEGDRRMATSLLHLDDAALKMLLIDPDRVEAERLDLFGEIEQL